MKVMQRLVQYCLIVAILLATVGFKVNSHYCPITKEKTTHFFLQPNCCCVETTNGEGYKKSCCENISSYYRADLQSIEKDTKQEAKIFKHLPGKQDAVYFQVHIRPVTLAKEPFYTLPPPSSGRTIGILNQTFII